MATSVNQGSVGDAYIDGLLIGTKWSGSFTFSFPQVTGDYQAGNNEADVAADLRQSRSSSARRRARS